MAVKVQSSFSAGELDPALHERTTLQKYSSGLATGRNVCVGKTGRLISRPGRKHLVQTSIQNRKVIIHPRSMTATFLEWGHLYVRVYNMAGTLLWEDTHTMTEDDLDYIDFADIDVFNTVVTLFGRDTLIVNYSDEQIYTALSLFNATQTGLQVSNSAGGTGYALDYWFTVVVNGQERNGFAATIASQLPITSSTQNDIVVRFLSLEPENVSEVKVYRRPANGGAFGYIGSTSYIVNNGTAIDATFTDYGQDADYAHTPPAVLAEFGEFINGDLPGSELSSSMLEDSASCCMYKQRLLLSAGGIICASRVGYPTNFLRDYPLSADGALSFQSSSIAAKRIYRMLENEFLAVFSSEGIYVHEGALSPTNLNLAKKGPWVIDPRVKPLAIPGGVIFVDSETNTVRSLTFSTETNAFNADEVSVFSDHLFTRTTVTSWAFQSGKLPLLWVTFSDGTYASFTYEPNQEMRAWTRHDSGTDIEYVASTRKSLSVDTVTPANSTLEDAQVIFVAKKSDGYRYIELGVPRYIDSDDITDNPEADKGASIAAMDSMVTWQDLINDDLSVGDQIDVEAVTVGDWDGELIISSTSSNLFVAGDVGDILRYFSTEDKTVVDMKVLELISARSVRVQPNCTFPSDLAEDIRLYRTQATFTGLSHMEGEFVSIVSDGYVVASPNNDKDNYPLVQVSGGAITLPKSKVGAIVHIGRPYTSDIETLDIDTVEQRPVLIESKTVNRVYVKVHNTRGLFVGNRFPDDDSVADMERLVPDSVDHSEDYPIVGSRYDLPRTERVDITIPGDWKSNGRICLRNVDPVHFEILSIIPDIDDERR